jgi:hypothetical protein
MQVPAAVAWYFDTSTSPLLLLLVMLCVCQVNAIETGADAITSVVFHSFHLLLISVDNRGYVRVNNGADGNLLNAFHVSNGAQQGGGGRE